MTDIISTDHPLTRAQQILLAALLDTLVPASDDGAMPSAADVGFDTYLLAQAEDLVPLVTSALQRFEPSFVDFPRRSLRMGPRIQCERSAAVSSVADARLRLLLPERSRARADRRRHRRAVSARQSGRRKEICRCSIRSSSAASVMSIESRDAPLYETLGTTIPSGVASGRR